ncbi:MAG: sigma-70 family RNA polymerase sigma factor [Sarcina sp.]
MRYDENALVNGLIKSNDDAFDYLLDTYGDDILRFCYMKVNDVGVAEDLAQETFINVFKYIQKFKGQSSLKTWIYKIALNQCREFYRKSKTFNKNFNGGVFELLDVNVKADFDLEEEILDIIDNEFILESLQKIRPQYRDIIYMFYYKELTIKDIAMVLKQNENTIKTRLRRGRSALRKVLKEDGIYG